MLACVLVMPMLTSTTCWSTPRKPLVMTSNFDISWALRIVKGPTLALWPRPAEPRSRPVGHRVLTAAVAMNSGSTAEKRARPEAETILSPAARPMRHALVFNM